MGIMDRLFDCDMAQRRDINSLRDSAVASARRIGNTRQRVGDVEARMTALEQELDQQHLFAEALYRTLSTKGVITADDFVTAIRQVDLEDGVADGKVTKPRATPKAEPPARRSRFRR